MNNKGYKCCVKLFYLLLNIFTHTLKFISMKWNYFKMKRMTSVLTIISAAISD